MLLNRHIIIESKYDIWMRYNCRITRKIITVDNLNFLLTTKTLPQIIKVVYLSCLS